MFAPRAFIFSSSACEVGTRSSSHNDLPTFLPTALRKVLAMPPPTTIWSTFSDRLSRTVSLVETLEPPTMATSGRAGLASALVSASSSSVNRMPAQATGAYLATPWVEASARWAVPKASMTKMSHNAAYFLAVSSLFFFSPLLVRQFSSSTTSPSATSKPPLTQSRITRTGLPSLAAITSATGLSESSSLNSPSVGRPKCEVTITFAPAFIACSIVGIEAVMRASEVTLPFLTGTFRSARMNTRLPASSRSVMRLKFMVFNPPNKTPVRLGARRESAGAG